MPAEVTRTITPKVQAELWGRAAGRCQFRGCNKPVYKSEVTQERVNIGEKAHIWSHAENGPRGRGDLNSVAAEVNGIENLLLVCGPCHDKLDQHNGDNRYTADLLKQWKAEHEERVFRVTEIEPKYRSHVVIYESRIGDQGARLNYHTCAQALFPSWHPAEDRAISLSMNSSHDDSAEDFWTIQESHLKREFDRRISPMIESGEIAHLSVFGLADMPLLILLGSLLIDRIPTTVFQLHRQPASWHWQDSDAQINYRIIPPDNTSLPPALLFSLSGKIHHDRVREVLGHDAAIWEMTIDECHNDFIRSEAHVTEFASHIPRLIERISAAHPAMRELPIFPAMPVSCSIELGRRRMPKAHAPWKIYDQNNKHRKFIPTITIGG